MILPPEISNTCSAHGAYPPAGSGRYCPKAGQPLAEVGTRREPRHALGPGSTIQRPMSGRSPNPHGEGRHRLHRVLSQQCHQTLDVVAFECVHVALEEVDVGRVERLGPGLRRQRAQCGPGPLQGAVDGGHARARGAPPPRPPANGGPHRGSGRRAGEEEDAAARRRRPGGSSRGTATISEGSDPSGATRASGTGVTQVASGSNGPSRDSMGGEAGPKSIGRARRCT